MTPRLLTSSCLKSWCGIPVRDIWLAGLKKSLSRGKQESQIKHSIPAWRIPMRKKAGHHDLASPMTAFKGLVQEEGYWVSYSSMRAARGVHLRIAFFGTCRWRWIGLLSQLGTLLRPELCNNEIPLDPCTAWIPWLDIIPFLLNHSPHSTKPELRPLSFLVGHLTPGAGLDLYLTS